MTANKAAFLMGYEAELKARYPWAGDVAKLSRFMESVTGTLYTEAKTWNHDGEAVTAAWRAMGCKGKPTLKALRALPVTAEG